MEIYLKLNVDREEGMQRSVELVADEIPSMLEGEQIDVEDSLFSITSVEVVASPKAKGPNLNEVLDRLYLADQAFHKAYTISLDGPAPDPTPEATENLRVALMNLFLLPAMGDLMLKARVRVAKAKQ